ncbi:MAG: class I SAM-dependent methyltransferase [Carboxydocellales bacterium]
MGAMDFSELLETERALAQGPSQTAEYAAQIFADRKQLPLLDLACGNGRDSLYLATQGFQVVGIDLAEKVISRLNLTTNVDFRLADACSLPFLSESFGVVYNFGLLHVFTAERAHRRQQVLEEISRVLLPGGLALLTILWTDQPGCGLPEICCLTEQEVDSLYHQFILREKTIVNDSSCTGWVGIYWRLLLQKPL